MKTITTIKQFVLTAILIAGINIYSSCDSCNRKDDNTQENTTDTDSYESAEEEDTLTTGDNTGMNDGSTSSTSINATSGSGTGKSVSTAGTSKNTTGTSTATSKDEAAKQQAITDMIENSDAKSAVDKNGKPIRSSGDAGSGTGTGTGSTGNNSRVTTREAQKAN